MLDYRLSKRKLAELSAAHRRTASAREAYRINTGILLGKGRTAADVADALLIDPETVAEYLENSRINLLFRPPYSPNLNLIEGF